MSGKEGKEDAARLSGKEDKEDAAQATHVGAGGGGGGSGDAGGGGGGGGGGEHHCEAGAGRKAGEGGGGDGRGVGGLGRVQDLSLGTEVGGGEQIGFFSGACKRKKEKKEKMKPRFRGVFYDSTAGSFAACIRSGTFVCVCVCVSARVCLCAFAASA